MLSNNGRFMVANLQYAPVQLRMWELAIQSVHLSNYVGVGNPISTLRSVGGQYWLFIMEETPVCNM
jgi:hypothetical protein